MNATTPTAASAHHVSASRFTEGGQTVHLEPTPRTGQRPRQGLRSLTCPPCTMDCAQGHACPQWSATGAAQNDDEALTTMEQVALCFVIGTAILLGVIFTGALAGYLWQRFGA